MQPTFLPPPTNPQQGNNFMNFPNGVSNQQGPPNPGPGGLGLSNQFANIDLNSSGSQGNSHGYGNHPPNSNMMAPFPVDPMKFSAPPTSSSGVNSFQPFTPSGGAGGNSLPPLSKPPLSQFTPSMGGGPNSFLSNASAPSPLPPNLLNNHSSMGQNSPSMPPLRPTSSTTPSFGPPSKSQYNQQSGPNQQGGAPPHSQSNQNEFSSPNSNPLLSGVNPPSSLPPTFDLAHQSQGRKSTSPQQLVQPPPNRQNSPQLPPTSMTPNSQVTPNSQQTMIPNSQQSVGGPQMNPNTQRMTPNSQQSQEGPPPSNLLQSPDYSSLSAFKPSSGGPFQPLKPSPFSPDLQSSTFPSQLGGGPQSPPSGAPQNSGGPASVRPPVSQDTFTSALPQGGAFPPSRIENQSQQQQQQPQQLNSQQQQQQQGTPQQQQRNSMFPPQSPPQGQQDASSQGNQNFPPSNSNPSNFSPLQQGPGGSFPPSQQGSGFPPKTLGSGDPTSYPSQPSTPGPNFNSPPGAGFPSMQSPRQQQFSGMPPSQGQAQPLSNGFPTMNGPPGQSSLGGQPLRGPAPPMSGPPLGGSSQFNGPPSGPHPSMNGPSFGTAPPSMNGPPHGAPSSMNGPPSGSFPPTSPPSGPGGRPNLSRPQYARPAPAGYPSQQQQQPGFPGSQQPPPGFPQAGPQQQPGGFPQAGSQQPPAGFPPLPQQQQQQPSGFPQPLQGGQQQGQPPLQGGFQPQTGGGFPPGGQKYPAQSPPGFPPQPGVQGPPQPGQYPPGYPPQQQPQQGYPPQSPPGFQPQQEYTDGMHYSNNNRPQAAPQKKLDPDNMPSRIQVMEDDRKNRSGEFRTDVRGALPPLVTTQFTVQDGGNCSPRYVRSTMYSVPTTPDIMKQVGVPFGLVISPLAKTIEGEMDPPEADFSQCGGPVRCGRCKAYMAPFMQFVDGGRRFHCPMCKATTEVPETYFAHMDALGQRMDKYQRPELCLGSYELLVSEEYCRGSKFPNPPALIFILDVSYSNVKSGLVSLLCSRMMDILTQVTNERLRVGFITYASSVHFYNIKSSLVKPELLEVTDVHEMFMPLLDGFLGTVEEAGTALQALMTQLPLLFQDTRQTETLLMPAIQAGLEALKANNTTGKLLVFNSSLPIYEAPGKLVNREDRKMLGTDKEKTVLTPANQAYNNLGQECVNEGVSVDLFVFNNAYVDLATIGQVSRLTGGQIYKYTYFQADTDGERLIEDIRRNIGRPTAYDAVMRVRTSTGIRPTDFYGHMYMSNTTDMEYGSMDSDKAVALELKHDDKLVPEEGVIIQVAFLYTSAYGVRKVRVHNLSLNCTPTMADIYRYCELDTLMNFLSKQCVAKINEASPRALRDALVNRTATILATYRKHCASPSSSLGQLILPECLKLLPLYANSLLRCDALSGGPEISLDDRSFALYSTSVMDIPTSVVYLYPHMISLHDIDPAALEEMPVQERCSYEKLQSDGAYLIDNSIYMFLWVGSSLSSQWVESVFGVPSAAQIDPDRPNLPELPNALSRRVLDIIDYVKSSRPRSMRLTVVRQKDKLEVVLRQFLIEDRGYTEQQMSYVDFLCHIHKEIRNQLS